MHARRHLRTRPRSPPVWIGPSRPAGGPPSRFAGRADDSRSGGCRGRTASRSGGCPRRAGGAASDAWKGSAKYICRACVFVRMCVSARHYAVPWCWRPVPAEYKGQRVGCRSRRPWDSALAVHVAAHPQARQPLHQVQSGALCLIRMKGWRNGGMEG